MPVFTICDCIYIWWCPSGLLDLNFNLYEICKGRTVNFWNWSLLIGFGLTLSGLRCENYDLELSFTHVVCICSIWCRNSNDFNFKKSLVCNILVADSWNTWFWPGCLDTSRRLDSQWNSYRKWKKIQGLSFSSSTSNVLHKLLKGNRPSDGVDIVQDKRCFLQLKEKPSKFQFLYFCQLYTSFAT